MAGSWSRGKSELPSSLLLGGRVSELLLLVSWGRGGVAFRRLWASPPSSWSLSPESPPTGRTASRWRFTPCPEDPAPQEGSNAPASAYQQPVPVASQWTPEPQETSPSPACLTPSGRHLSSARVTPITKPREARMPSRSKEAIAGQAERGGHVG